MSLGNGFAIFASKSGEVYGIGKNDYGQLGTGDSIGRTEFVRCTKLEEWGWFWGLMRNALKKSSKA